MTVGTPDGTPSAARRTWLVNHACTRSQPHSCATAASARSLKMTANTAATPTTARAARVAARLSRLSGPHGSHAPLTRGCRVACVWCCSADVIPHCQAQLCCRSRGRCGDFASLFSVMRRAASRLSAAAKAVAGAGAAAGAAASPSVPTSPAAAAASAAATASGKASTKKRAREAGAAAAAGGGDDDVPADAAAADAGETSPVKKVKGKAAGKGKASKAVAAKSTGAATPRAGAGGDADGDGDGDAEATLEASASVIARVYNLPQHLPSGDKKGFRIVHWCVRCSVETTAIPADADAVGDCAAVQEREWIARGVEEGLAGVREGGQARRAVLDGNQDRRLRDGVGAWLRGCMRRHRSRHRCSRRVPPAQLSKSLPGYAAHWCCCTGKKGYSGSAIFCRDGVAPLSVTRGVGVAEHDAEGRVITAEFDKFFLVCTYVPNSGAALDRLEYRTTAWDAAMLAFLKGLEAKGKPVVRGREPCRRHVTCLRCHVVCAWLSCCRCGRVTSTSHTRTWTSTTPCPTYAHVLFSLCVCVW